MNYSKSSVYFTLSGHLIQTNHVSSEQSSHVAGGRHAGQHSFRD